MASSFFLLRSAATSGEFHLAFFSNVSGLAGLIGGRVALGSILAGAVGSSLALALPTNNCSMQVNEITNQARNKKLDVFGV